MCLTAMWPRKYNGFGFNVQIADDVDTINAKIDLTL